MTYLTWIMIDMAYELVYGSLMSLFLTVPTACGATTTDIDVFDLELNPHGGVCCDACESIIQAR